MSISSTRNGIRQPFIPDTRKEYGESRFLAYVPIDSRLYAVVYAVRGDKRRIISLRKANTRERMFYEEARRG